MKESHSFQTTGNTNPATRRHTSEQLNPKQILCANLKARPITRNAEVRGGVATVRQYCVC
jgi:hypothetical protein